MMICGKSGNSICLSGWNFVHEKGENICKKCLTFPCGSGIVNKLSQGIASEILKNKIVFRKFKLTVDNRLNLW